MDPNVLTNPMAMQWQSYMNWANMSTFSDDIYGSQMMSNPMSMNGNIIPFTGSDEYWDRYNEQRTKNLQSQMDYSDTYRQTTSERTARSNDVDLKRQELSDVIARNKQDRFEEVFDAYVNSVAARDNITEEQATALARAEYAKSNEGRTIEVDLRMHNEGSFLQGILQGSPIGFLTKKTTADENISEVTGKQPDPQEKALQTGGQWTGAAVSAAAGCMLLPIVPVGTIAGGLILAGTVFSAIKNNFFK